MRLHEAAAQRWRHRCPCCDRHMKHFYLKKGKATPSDFRTCGHDRAVAHGGDRHMWLFICHRCNNEQGWLSFAAWARMLILRNDPRAELVAEVARFVAAWRQEWRRAA
jgi:hypothetical protein